MNNKNQTASKKSNTPANATQAKPTETQTSSYALAFGPVNYIIMAVGLVMLGLGYIFLSGGGSDDPTVFNAEMFNTRRLVVAPILIVAGFVVEICAIMIRPRDKKDNNPVTD